jgi:hypothetical protein
MRIARARHFPRQLHDGRIGRKAGDLRVCGQTGQALTGGVAVPVFGQYFILCEGGSELGSGPNMATTRMAHNERARQTGPQAASFLLAMALALPAPHLVAQMTVPGTSRRIQDPPSLEKCI